MADFAQPTGAAPMNVAPGAPQPAAQQLPPSPLEEFRRDIAAKNDIAAMVKLSVTVSLDQVETVLRAHPAGPKTLESIRNLFEAAFAKAGVYDAAHPFFVRDLADLCGPKTMPLRTLVELVGLAYEIKNNEERAAAAAPAG